MGKNNLKKKAKFNFKCILFYIFKNKLFPVLNESHYTKKARSKKKKKISLCSLNANIF